MNATAGGSHEGRRRAGILASALLAATIHAAVLFGFQFESRETLPFPHAIEVTLLAPIRTGPAAAEPAVAHRPPAPAIAPLPRKPIPRPKPPAERAPARTPAPEPAREASDSTAIPAETAAVATPPQPHPESSRGAPGAPAGSASVARPRYKTNPPPLYPAAARRHRQQGVVLLSVRVDASGRPEAISVQTSSGVRALDDAARDAVEDWEFEPGRRDGVPVSSQVEVPIRFELDPG